MENNSGKKLWLKGLVLCAAIGVVVAAAVKGAAKESEI